MDAFNRLGQYASCPGNGAYTVTQNSLFSSPDGGHFYPKLAYIRDRVIVLPFGSG